VDVLKDERSPRDLRLLCIDVLGTLQSPVAVEAFIDRATDDPDGYVRDACLDQLSRFGTARAVQKFQQLLESADNKVVNRAAVCLGALKDPSATLSLIEALVTEHKFIIKTGGGPGQLNLGFGGGPGGGGNAFGVGGRPKVVTKSLNNEGALNALVAINPGINFGYDIDAWKQWFIDRHRPPPVSLRRDE
jgi:hypothetical protein